MTTAPASPTSDSAAGVSLSDSRTLPRVDVLLSPVEIVARLETAARRGRLPGFHRAGAEGRGGGTSDALFVLTDFGTPFESVLEGLARAQGAGCVLTFRTRLKPLMPWVFTLMLVASVWPGVWLTDSLIRTYFPSYDIATWKWYIPLTAPFVPLAIWSAVKRSRAAGHAAAEELIRKIQGLLGPGGPPAATPNAPDA